MLSRRASSCRSGSGLCGVSTLSAPTTSCPTLIGTQRNEVSDPLPRLVLSSSSGDSLLRGMIAGSPVRMTCPVTPSPSL